MRTSRHRRLWINDCLPFTLARGQRPCAKINSNMQTGDLLNSYHVDPNTWDEMYAALSVRPQYQGVLEFLQQMSIEELNKKEELAKRLFMSQGITFTVYSSGEGIEKIFPFDIIPRIITAAEWKYIESGIKQRLKALNLFLKDVYNNQFILKDGVVPVEMVYSCPHFLREMHGFPVPHDIYVHIAGIDLIRDHDGTFYILEDNLRTPSGVSYMLENREITKRIFPDLIPRNRVPRYPAPEPGLAFPPADGASYDSIAYARHLQFRLFRTYHAGPAHGCRARRRP
jgi:uncharacterized circularly permuted ATP-grasp superfamily protein